MSANGGSALLPHQSLVVSLKVMQSCEFRTHDSAGRLDPLMVNAVVAMCENSPRRGAVVTVTHENGRVRLLSASLGPNGAREVVARIARFYLGWVGAGRAAAEMILMAKSR